MDTRSASTKAKELSSGGEGKLAKQEKGGGAEPTTTGDTMVGSGVQGDLGQGADREAMAGVGTQGGMSQEVSGEAMAGPGSQGTLGQGIARSLTIMGAPPPRPIQGQKRKEVWEPQMALQRHW